MIPDIENDYALNDEKYDDVKAYKIIRKYYEEAKSDLMLMKNRFEKNQSDIRNKELQLENIKNSYDENIDLFRPSAIRSNSKEEIELINHEILTLNETGRIISENILNLTERVAEFSFILSVFENRDNTDLMKNMDDVRTKINFCISLIDVDRERVKEELFHVKHLLN